MSGLFMNKSSDDWNKLKHLVDLSAENARLKAEVAYLKGEEHPYADLGSMMPKYLLEHWVKENARLKAEVERLRKAGDAMAETLEGAGFDSAMDFWNAAKEGKPSV